MVCTIRLILNQYNLIFFQKELLSVFVYVSITLSGEEGMILPALLSNARDNRYIEYVQVLKQQFVLNLIS